MRVELSLDENGKITKRMEKMEFCKIKQFSEVIGQLNFAIKALQYSSIYFRFGYLKYLALVKKDLRWWKNIIFTLPNQVKNFQFELEIFSDASLIGWGASFVFGKTYGWWNSQKQEVYINILELETACESITQPLFRISIERMLFNSLN